MIDVISWLVLVLCSFAPQGGDDGMKSIGDWLGPFTTIWQVIDKRIERDKAYHDLHAIVEWSLLTNPSSFDDDFKRYEGALARLGSVSSFRNSFGAIPADSVIVTVDVIVTVRGTDSSDICTRRVMVRNIGDFSEKECTASPALSALAKGGRGSRTCIFTSLLEVVVPSNELEEDRAYCHGLVVVTALPKGKASAIVITSNCVLTSTPIGAPGIWRVETTVQK